MPFAEGDMEQRGETHRLGIFAARGPIAFAAWIGIGAWMGAASAAGPDDLSQFRVTRPGIVLVDRATRLDELARMGSRSLRFCRVHDSRPLFHDPFPPSMDEVDRKSGG